MSPTTRLLIFAMALFLALSTAAGAAAAPSNGPAYQVEWGARIPMRDGVRLNATIYRPYRQQGRLPVIMTLTPYVGDRFHAAAAYFAGHGYVFALVDSRGRGNSEGSFEPWVNEGRDGFDAVEWLSRRPYSDGQVAMWGGSYGGKNQWAVASLVPPALRTIAPASAGYVGFDVPMRRNIPMPWSLQYLTLVSGRTSNRNLYSDQPFWNAAFDELSRGEVPFRDFGRIAGIENPYFRLWADHPEPDTFWDAANPDPGALGAIDIPVLTVTGLYDDAQTGALEFQRLHLEGASDRARSRHFTVIGPWNHEGSRLPMRFLGGVDFGPEAVLDVLRLHLAWYDWVMKGGPRPDFLRERFVYFLAGAGRWEASPDMPGVAGGETLFPTSPGRAANSVATRGGLSVRPRREPADSYLDDPALPALNEGPEAGAAVSDNFLTDPRSIERLDGDGLIYDSEAFLQGGRLVGRPRAILHFAIDVPDSDIRVQLFELFADGHVLFLAQDQIRARYRNGPRRPEPVPSGVPQRYLFDQFPFVARAISPGSRLRLVISPLGRSIHHQRNRNSGGVVALETAADNRVAHVSLVLGPGLSRLIVPIAAPRP